MEWLIAIVVVGFITYMIWGAVQERMRTKRMAAMNVNNAKVVEKKNELRRKLEVSFLVQPCFRCHEFDMRLLEISPNGRSIHYQCMHCSKKTRSLAGTPDAAQAIELMRELRDLVVQHNNQFGDLSRFTMDIEFVAPAAAMPYEQTTRTPIPEAVRSEVWRRDGGRCVQCGSKQNLQFDHIIPVIKGGSNTARNVQLLCEACNRQKSASIG